MVLYVPTLKSASIAVAVGDYAASTGTTGADVDIVFSSGPTVHHNGAFRAVTGLRFAEITDGLTNTILSGEKQVDLLAQGKPPNDCGIYDGHHPSCSQRAGGPNFPLATGPGDPGWRFGSTHPGLCQFVFCDGTVRPLSTSVNPLVLGLLTQRNDDVAVPDF